MDKMLAISIKGAEFMYNRNSAHRVSKRSAQEICDVLNELRYKLDGDDKVWYVHDCGFYELNHTGAGYQQFTKYRHKIFDKIGKGSVW